MNNDSTVSRVNGRKPVYLQFLLISGIYLLELKILENVEESQRHYFEDFVGSAGVCLPETRKVRVRGTK